MSGTSVQVRTWIDRALHSETWIGATQAADAAISACPDTPITTAEDASARRASWEALGQAIGDTETAVKPLRSRIHELRTELARRVTAVIEPAQARVDVVRRSLGAWDAQERVRLAAHEAEQRKISSDAAHHRLVQAQDVDIDPSHQGSVFGPAGPQAPDGGAVGDQATPVDPFDAQGAVVKHDQSCPKCFGTGKDCVGKPCDYVTSPTGPTGPTKKKWVMEILDADKLRDAILALPTPNMLQTALRVHEPTLRKMLANELGREKAMSAFPPGYVVVRCEDQAVRSRKAKA